MSKTLTAGTQAMHHGEECPVCKSDMRWNATKECVYCSMGKVPGRKVPRKGDVRFRAHVGPREKISTR